MLRPLIERPRRSQARRSRECGVTMALVAVAIFSIIAMAGLAVDLGTLYEASAEAQRAADAAALAAARMISISGVTGDPTNHFSHWQDVCGGPNSPASSAATAEAQLNTIAGTSNPTVTVKYSVQGGTPDPNCANQTAAFGVNPLVIVFVQKTNLPTYFSRIWGYTGSSVSGTATAEVFNPSNSGLYSASGNPVPVQPRCVKPWMTANRDPNNGGQPFFTLPGGTIGNPGIIVNGAGTGVIGETLILSADCTGTAVPCTMQPGYNPPKSIPPLTVQYLPAVPGTSVAVPSCGNSTPYQQAISGCDQTTQYQCGVQYPLLSNPNQVDLTENPSGVGGDTTVATQCLTNQLVGADSLDTSVFPYQIRSGAGNPLNISSAVITSSNSIVTVPIFDSTAMLTPNGANIASVTIVGFLQVFIQSIDGNGNPNVTVLNVAGCGTGVPNGTTPAYGTSPVPVRLITPP